MAIGAYAMAILVLKVGLNFWLSLPLAVLITVGVRAPDRPARAAIARRLLRDRDDRDRRGRPHLRPERPRPHRRQRGAVLRAGRPEQLLSERLEGRLGLDQRFVENFWSDPDSLFPLLLVVWATVLVVTVGLTYVTKTPWGRVLRAIREDEDAALALGKNTLRFKLQSLSISASLGAIGGFFLAINLRHRPPAGLRAAGHLLRLQRADPRRVGQLQGGRVRGGPVLVRARGDPLHRPARSARSPRPGSPRCGWRSPGCC